MAEPRRRGDDLVDNPAPDETRSTEQERVRSSNDRDQAKERAGGTVRHNRGYDNAVGGNAVDDIDRDDTRAE